MVNREEIIKTCLKNNVIYCKNCQQTFQLLDYPNDFITYKDKCPICNGTLLWLTVGYFPSKWIEINDEDEWW